MKKIDPGKFNAEQYRAITAPSTIDILISAGAGSGKTNTLSERVNRLIIDREVDPSSILILTFTDNAAHEMEGRIVESFKGESEPEIKALADKMLSAHIQTFDSFSQYLVSTNASRLGISSSISILDSSIESAKIRSFLDEIVAERYEDPSQKERFAEMLSRYNLKDDKNTKNVVLSVFENLQKLMPQRKKDFFAHYDERFFSKEAFMSWRKEYIDGLRGEVRYALLKVAYLWNYDASNDTLEKTNAFFDKPAFFQSPYGVSLDCYPFLSGPYEEVSSLLGMDDDSFVKRVKELQKDKLSKKYHFPSAKQMENYEDDRKLKDIYKILCGLFETKEAPLIDANLLCSDAEEDYRAYLDTKVDVHLILDLVQELEKRLSSYKKETNCFTFSDVSSMALRLLTEKEFEDIAEKVRSRFSYIMVDEYQDTNDFQEAFLNSLLKPNRNGKRAHLFCVGDPKQAIYAFRNSNVQLFMNRQEELKGKEGAEVIHMNKNYRSGPHLLDEINYVFSYYMRKDQGDVDYLDPGEQLAYDGKIYKKSYNHFGLSRIVSSRGFDDFKDPLDYEINAILNDIKRRVENKFEVYDRKNDAIRPCTYGDFAILCRTKKGFSAFQKAFQEGNVPLNVKVDTNLLDVNAVLSFESLVGMLRAVTKKDDSNLPHLFASLARSYLFQYDDSKVFSILGEAKAGGESLQAIKEDAIYQSLLSFSEKHAESSFREIFLDLINEFGVVRRLYEMGNVRDNVEKLDSLFSLLLTQEKMGEGLGDFVELFSTIKKHDLPFSAETSVNADNSVDLMTIHASKGLERNVVYMPVSQNKLSKGGGAGPDYVFSSSFGILLPRYTVSPWLACEEGEERSQSVHSLPWLLHLQREKKKDPDFDEHVRLFYVALTRARNSVCIVGDDANPSRGNLYHMLNHLPHRYVFSPNVLTRFLEDGTIPKAAYQRYLDAVEIQNNARLISKERFGQGIPSSLCEERYPMYLKMREEFLLQGILKEINDSLDAMKEALLAHYKALALPKKDDLDFCAKMFAYFKPDFSSVSDHSSYLEKAKEVFGLEKEEADRKLLSAVDEWLCEDGSAASKTKKKNDDLLLSCLASVIDHCPYVMRVSYENGEKFRDPVKVYQYEKASPLQREAIHIDKIPEERISNDPIVFERKTKERASKKAPIDRDSPLREALDFGVRLHRDMELIDLREKDVGFIENEGERKRIEKVLKTKILNDLDGFEIHQEFGYFDEELLTTGSIDLLLVGKGEIRIVDYKTKHIDDPAYLDQLRAYRRNVCSLFHVDPSFVKAYLLPLTGEEAVLASLD